MTEILLVGCGNFDVIEACEDSDYPMELAGPKRYDRKMLIGLCQRRKYYLGSR